LPLAMPARAWRWGVVGPLVDDAGEHPVAVRHDRLGADDQREFQAVERDVAVMPAVDAVDHQGRLQCSCVAGACGLVKMQGHR